MQQIEQLLTQCLTMHKKAVGNITLSPIGLTLTTQYGLANFHLSPPHPHVSDLLNDFHLAGQNNDTTTALKECIELCTIELDEPNAAKLLVK